MPTTPSEDIQKPSTSQTQMLERQLSVEVSSFSSPIDKDQDIKDRHKKIKMKNTRLKAKTYAQYLKLTPTNQTRLIGKATDVLYQTYNSKAQNIIILQDG